jgi:hypothetical protein
MSSEQTEPLNIRGDARWGNIDDERITHVLPDLGVVEDGVHEFVHDCLANTMPNSSPAG